MVWEESWMKLAVLPRKTSTIFWPWKLLSFLSWSPLLLSLTTIFCSCFEILNVIVITKSLGPRHQDFKSTSTGSHRFSNHIIQLDNGFSRIAGRTLTWWLRSPPPLPSFRSPSWLCCMSTLKYCWRVCWMTSLWPRPGSPSPLWGCTDHGNDSDHNYEYDNDDDHRHHHNINQRLDCITMLASPDEG